MQAIKIIGWTTALSLVLAPVAFADDTGSSASSSGSYEQCIDNCNQAFPGSKGAKTGQRIKKSVKRSGVNPESKTSVEVNINDGRSAELLNAEERARAAEQLRAEEQAKDKAAFEAESIRIRDEERAAAAARERAALAEQKAADEARMQQALAEERAKHDGDVIKDAVLTPMGIYGYVGGGATQFTEPSSTGSTGVGGYWDARLGIGTRSILGAELAYVGGSRDITALGLNQSAFLMNNGVEGVARLNVPITMKQVPFLVEPYTFGGIGWQHYNLVNVSENTSSVQDNDDVLTVPVGLGLAFGFSGFTLDLRGTYRHSVGSDLLGTSNSSFDSTSLNAWGAGAALGFEL